MSNLTFDSFEVGAVAPAKAAKPAPTWEVREPAHQSDRELLAELVGDESAGEILGAAGSVRTLLSWGVSDFNRVDKLRAGRPLIGYKKAKVAVALLELGRRAMAIHHEEPPHLKSADSIMEYMRPKVAGLQVEKFWVLLVNRKNRLLKCVEVTSGTATSALAHPREVFKEACRESATALFCVHNHPSGDPCPSAADLQVTRQLADASRTLDIDLLDHVIIGRSGADPLGLGHFSFRAAGIL